MKIVPQLIIVAGCFAAFGGLIANKATVSTWIIQASSALGFKDEIYHWNTAIAWGDAPLDNHSLEAGPFIERQFPFLDLTVRAKKVADGSLLAAVYFRDDCVPGSKVVTEVVDYREEPFEMICTTFSDSLGWRVGARLPNETASWFETYGEFSVRLRFSDWDFGIIDKYAKALEI